MCGTKHDRPSGCEDVEISDAALRAGARALMSHGVLVSPNMDLEEGCELAEEVFRAMLPHLSRKLLEEAGSSD